MSEKRELGNKLMLDFSKITDPGSGKGLVPVVVQDIRTNEVLMVAFADNDAVELMLEGEEAAFWSRSRQQSWVKGKTSGNTMTIIQMLVDCDQDTLVVRVDPQGDGRACHVTDPDEGENFATCFYRCINREKGILERVL